MSYQPLNIEYGTFNNNRHPMVNLYGTSKFYEFINSLEFPVIFENKIIIKRLLFEDQPKMAVFYNLHNIFNIDNNGNYDFIENVKPKIFIMIIEFLVKESFITINFDK